MAKIVAIMCSTPQEVWCPARHQDEAASAAVLVKCRSLVIRVERTRSDIASLTRLEFDNSKRREREGKTGFSNSEAKYSKDTLQHANIARAELMDDVVTIQRVISVLRRR